MKWLRARIRSFRSFTDEQEFTFPSEPGLYYLTGRNEAEPRLGANGAGKTTLWEAIHWLFFGKTVTGLAAGQVAPWAGDKGTRVELDYEDADGQVFTLGRTWSPNRWYLVHPSGTDELLLQDESNLALDHLGMKQAPFLHCILMAQGEGMFFDLKAEAATSLFSQILDLDRWLDLSVKAGKMATEADREMRRLESALARLQGNLDGLAKTGFPFTAEEWEASQKKKIRAAEQDFAKHVEEQDAISKKLEEARSRVKYLEEKAAGAASDRARIDDRGADNASARASDLRASMAVLSREADRVAKEAKEWDDRGPCPTCGHAMTKEERQRQLTVLLDRLDELEEEISSTQARLDVALAAESKASAQRAIASSTERETEAHLNAAKGDLYRLEQDYKQIDRILDRIADEVEALDREANPVTQAERRLERERSKLKREISNAQAEMEEAERKWRLYTFWVRGFKDIRLSQVTEALTQLEIEVNSCVNQLGLVGWKIMLRTDADTKAGGVKRGFSVEVLSPANQKPVPWKSWSGGEGQRLRLAGNMGLANLIRNRMGITLPIEVWDEPTQFLSPGGVSDLLDALSARALEEQRQIWVVDHRSLGYGSFDGVVTVVKTKKGSRFEQ